MNEIEWAASIDSIDPYTGYIYPNCCAGKNHKDTGPVNATVMILNIGEHS